MGVSQTLTITQKSQSVANNTTTVEIKLTSTQNNGSYNTLTKTGYYWISVNGGAETKYTFTTTLPANSTITCFSVNHTFTHKADGTGSISVRTSLDTGISAGTVTTSKTFTPSTIPRATQPSVSPTSVVIGENVTISMPRASSSFTHTLKYKCGTLTGTIGTGLGTSKTWTVPSSFIAQFPNSNSGSVTITCETYNGTTKIGEKTIGFGAIVPNDILPIINSVTLTDPTGNKTKYGKYVQGKSTCKVHVNASGNQGSTIKSYSIRVNDTSYSTNDATSGIISDLTASSVVVIVIDSRGRQKEYKTAIEIVAYAAPRPQMFKYYRCNEDGSANAEGSFFLFEVKAEFSPIENQNHASTKLQYKNQNDDNWLTIAEYTTYSTNVSHIVPANVDYVFEIKVIFEDDFHTFDMTATIPSAFTLMDFHSSGKGIAIGKVSQNENKFDIYLPTNFHEETEVNGKRVLVYNPYSSGNRIDVNNFVTGGIITNSNKRCEFSVPIKREFEDGAKVTVESLDAGIRTINRNFLNNNNAEWVGLSGIDVKGYVDIESNTVLVRISADEAFTNGYNNSPIGVYITSLVLLVS